MRHPIIKYVIIVAGGSGKRMKDTSASTAASLPKQFLLLSGLPILMHTLNKFYQYDGQIKIIVALPYVHIAYWETLCQKYRFSIPHTVVRGGTTRFYSVKNGLNVIKEEGIVVVHDGVRPLVSISTIASVFETTEKKGNAVPVIPVQDSIRKIVGKNNHSLDRKLFYQVQTPQGFYISDIKQAYKQKYKFAFTDDASVFETTGKKIMLVEGNKENIKITTAVDLQMAEVILLNMRTNEHLNR